MDNYSLLEQISFDFKEFLSAKGVHGPMWVNDPLEYNNSHQIEREIDKHTYHSQGKKEKELLS